MKSRVKKLVFFSSISEVDDYLVRHKPKVSDCLFIAMNPVVRFYSGQKGIQAQDTLKYFTNDSHKGALERSKLIIDWLRKTSDFSDPDMGIERAFNDWFVLLVRCSTLYCLWSVEVVLNAIALHEPEVICASYSPKIAVSSLCIEPEEKYLGYLVKEISIVKNLKFEAILPAAVRNLSILYSGIDYCKSILKFVIKLISFYSWQKKVEKDIPAFRRPILFTSKLYQMDKLAANVKDKLKDKSFLILEPPVVASFKVPNFIFRLFWKKYLDNIIRQKSLLKDLAELTEKETEIFSYRDIAFARVISQKIQDNIANLILGAYLWAVRLDKYINKLNPSVIISNGARYDDLILAELCNKKYIPIVLISHGSHVPPKNKYEDIEWRENNRTLLDGPFSYFALQSPLAEAYLNTFPTNGKAAVRTGPLTWGTAINLKKSELAFKKMFSSRYEFKDVKIVMHAGTPKETKALRLYVYETPDEYIKSLCDLANAVKGIPHVILIIKFRPSSELSVEGLKRLVPFSEKVVLSVEEPFIDVLGLADLLVSFSSTTIEEALQNRIPVLLYGGQGRYQHIPAFEIESDDSINPSAVYHVKETRNLGNAINKILNLDMTSAHSEHLFEPYIYSHNRKTAFVDLLKEIAK
ncbi:MAG: hypothetical protein AMJ78_01105 [Omnitrophica WOR_2 bacterium SM23_29]|nr:MAG: hypothetical protein AMJ78_01105 [Omnitrophica WOR_2 bacterium SM23_29]